MCQNWGCFFEMLWSERKEAVITFSGRNRRTLWGWNSFDTKWTCKNAPKKFEMHFMCYTQCAWCAKMKRNGLEAVSIFGKRKVHSIVNNRLWIFDEVTSLATIIRKHKTHTQNRITHYFFSHTPQCCVQLSPLLRHSFLIHMWINAHRYCFITVSYSFGYTQIAHLVAIRSFCWCCCCCLFRFVVLFHLKFHFCTHAVPHKRARERERESCGMKEKNGSRFSAHLYLFYFGSASMLRSLLAFLSGGIQSDRFLHKIQRLKRRRFEHKRKFAKLCVSDESNECVNKYSTQYNDNIDISSFIAFDYTPTRFALSLTSEYRVRVWIHFQWCAWISF